eukprot:c20855_g1_i1 orf=180-710(+)
MANGTFVPPFSMANTTFVPPSNMEFNIGSIERKMDMTLDEIIKMSKKSKRQRAPVKSGNTKLNARVSKSIRQRAAASRSSALRQGKFAESRERGNSVRFLDALAAAKPAFTFPVTTRTKQRTTNWNEAKCFSVANPVASSKVVAKLSTWRPHTLDALFASLREQRMQSERNSVWMK